MIALVVVLTTVFKAMSVRRSAVDETLAADYYVENRLLPVSFPTNPTRVLRRHTKQSGTQPSDELVLQSVARAGLVKVGCGIESFSSAYSLAGAWR